MKKWILFLAAAAAAPVVLAPQTRAVSTSLWTQTSEADFGQGTFDNVVATNLGDLKLSRAVKTLLEQDARISSVNALVEAPDGTIYAGTAPHGLLLEIKGDAVRTINDPINATLISALAFDNDGRLLVGVAGESGRVLRLEKGAADSEKPASALLEIFKADGVQYVWGMTVAADGNVYVATGPLGQLFELKPDGSSRVLMDCDENNLLSIAAGGKDADALYVGTDPNGLVYRVNRKTGESFVLYDAGETEISALALDKHGNLYAGTAEARDEPQPPAQAVGATDQTGRPEGGSAGVPIPTEPTKDPEPPALPDPTPGQPEPIPKSEPDAKEPAKAEGSASIGGLRRVFPPGVLFTTLLAAGDEPGAGDGGDAPAEPPAEVPDNPGGDGGDTEPAGPNQPGRGNPSAASTNSAVPGRQPAVNVAGAGEPRPDGNAVYRIDPEGYVTEIFRQRVLVLSMVERDGTLLLGTGSDGLVYQINPAADETVVLAKVEPKQIMSLLPTRDGNIYMGMANTGGLAALSSGHAKEGSYTSGVLDATQVSKFGKLRLHGYLPAGTSLTISTRSGNVKDPAERSWSKWSEPASATEFVTITAPSARFFQYRLTFTGGDGAKQSPVVEDVSVAYQMPNLPPQVRTVRITPAAENAPAGGADDARVPPARKQQIAWEAADPNGDTLHYSLYFRRGATGPWVLMRDRLTDAQHEWDTRLVADGRYEVKVVASDAKANPAGTGRNSSRVSDPVVVDNTAPVVGDVRSQPKGSGARVEVKVVDKSSTVAAVDYSVNSQRDWQAVLPSDGIFDGPSEDVAFSVSNLKPGTHQVAVRATDAKGNQAFETVIVTVEAPAARKD